jgi:hypothetical protein
LRNQLETTKQHIRTVEDDQQQATKTYRNKSVRIYKECQNEESKCLQFMQELIQKFINALQIESPSSGEAKQKHHAYGVRKKNHSCTTDDDYDYDDDDNEQ